MSTLLVATPGGHLEELRLLLEQRGLSFEDATWVTAKTVQTAALLQGKSVEWVPPVGSGGFAAAMRSVPLAMQLHRRHRPRLVISTGAALAAPHLLAAAAHRCDIWYVESATRFDAPSKTGELAQRLPRSHLFVQNDGWGDARWQRIHDAFDGFAVASEGSERAQVNRVAVTFGTERFPFRRARDRLLAVLEGREVYWQAGASALPGMTAWDTPSTLRNECSAADAVVTHGGVGSILMALQVGKVPVVLPRSARHGEHIDEHQVQIAANLERRGLVVRADADGVTLADLRRAAAMTATRKKSKPADDLLVSWFLDRPHRPMDRGPASV